MPGASAGSGRALPETFNGQADQAKRWGDLRQRVLSAALLAPTAVACIWLGADAWTALMALAAGGLAYEWVALCGARPWRMPGLVVPAVVLFAGLIAVLDRERWALVALAAGAALAGLTSGRRAMVAGVLYVGLASVALVWLRSDNAAGRANVLFLVIVVWASDIGAYAAGRLLGGRKLAPAISPGKTWSGAVGGLLAAMAVGEAAGGLLAVAPIGRAAMVAGLLGLAAQAGDLLESAIKRHFGVKDSGKLIPGHGGLLDRLDGLLTAAPAAAALALLLGRGVALWQ